MFNLNNGIGLNHFGSSWSRDIINNIINNHLHYHIVSILTVDSNSQELANIVWALVALQKEH
eukprot:274366-Karenia_brevis.AAC.1